jgi:hypothetical protein
MPLKISTESNTEEPLTRTQKQLVNLHNALTKEAKLQGLAKYQVGEILLFGGNFASL